ncbi:MAG: hypothetical protein RBS68_10330 [Anaerolineales bacterium]|jgi:hypothetical protein|nr:hypothetical protein [Anaerolineales bacterium]
MKNQSDESCSSPTPNPIPRDWRIDTLRPFLKKFQQQLNASETKLTRVNLDELPGVFDEEECPENRS